MNQIIQSVSAFLVGGVAAAVLIPILIRRQRARLQSAAVRELHHGRGEPVSRFGGLALAAAFALVIVAVFVFGLAEPEHRSELAVVAAGSLAMFGLGFWDDLKPLGARKKLAGQVLIATAIWFMGIGIDRLSNPLGDGAVQLGAWGLAVTILWLVALTNLINLIDGLDGLACGLSLMLVGLLIYFRMESGTTPFLSLAVAGALVVFLKYNFPPARIYLGDGGSYFLGFFIGASTIVSSHKGTVAAALIAPLFVLTLPIIDVSLAILRRGLKGLPIFRPDRDHIHHKLLDAGMSRRKAVLGLYAFTSFFLILALIVWWGQGRGFPILLGFGTLCLLLLAGRFDFSREWFAVGRVLGNSVGMREEVGYALTVTRWLDQEARRVQSMDEFWSVMRFAAERLGFTALSLELPDGRREWRVDDNSEEAVHQRRFDLGHVGAGVVELESRLCNHLDPSGEERPKSGGCGRPTACVGDRRVFYVVSELFVEVWHKASQQLKQTTPTLQFDSQFDRARISDTPAFRWIRSRGTDRAA